MNRYSVIRPPLSRRAVVIGAGGTVAAATLAACGGSPGAAPGGQSVPPAKLRFTSQNVNPPHSDAEQQVVDLFRERNKNVQVETELYKGEDVREKLIVLSAAGTAPDVADIETKWMPGFYVKNLLQDLTPHAKRMGIKPDDYYPQEWQKAQIGGKLLCFPLDLQIVVMFFNKDLFQSKGVTLPPAKWDDPKWTWDEALLRARQLTSGEGAQKTFGIDFSRGWVYSYPLIWSNGGTVLNKDHTKATLTDGTTVDSIQFRADLILKHKVHPDPDELKAGTDAMAMFINKRLAMEAIWSPWAFRIADEDQNVNYDMAPMPRVKSGAFARPLGLADRPLRHQSARSRRLARRLRGRRRRAAPLGRRRRPGHPAAQEDRPLRRLPQAQGERRRRAQLPGRARRAGE